MKPSIGGGTYTTPRSSKYEGRIFRVTRAKLNVTDAMHVSSQSELATVTARICSHCGHGHLGDQDAREPSANVCEHCKQVLTDEGLIANLYRIETVETAPPERISINDEERQRQGYELQTTYKFLPGPNGIIQRTDAEVRQGDEVLARLTYAPAAQVWRINRGWRRRKEKSQLGFYINPISGTWSKEEAPDAKDENDAPDDPTNDRVPNQRIVPFVEDHRNILILTPRNETLSDKTMATLQAALRRGIEQTFQIEESELVAEPLPDTNNRRALLFYEAAEGGAGVLTRLATERSSLAQVAATALRLMHYRAPQQQGRWCIDDLDAHEETRETDGRQTRICEAGCYRCLLSYYNQPDHDKIDRRDRDALGLLTALANADVVPSNSDATDADTMTNSGVDNSGGAATEERLPVFEQWLDAIARAKLQPPDAYEVAIDGGAAVADAQYKHARALIFLAPPEPAIREYAAERRYRIIVFGDQASWNDSFAQYPDVFGNGCLEPCA